MVTATKSRAKKSRYRLPSSNAVQQGRIFVGHWCVEVDTGCQQFISCHHPVLKDWSPLFRRRCGYADAELLSIVYTYLGVTVGYLL